MRAWSFQAPGVWITAHGVVLADTEDEARDLVYAAMLIAAAHQNNDRQRIDLVELNTTEAKAYILFNGDL